MRRWIFALVLGVTACAAETRDAGKRERLGAISDEEFASRPECQRAMDNLYRIYAESPTFPVERKELFDRTEHERRQRERVRKCTITLSRRDAACLAAADDLLDVWDCPRFY